MAKFSVVVDLGGGATARLCFSKKPTEKELEDLRSSMAQDVALLKSQMPAKVVPAKKEIPVDGA